MLVGSYIIFFIQFGDTIQTARQLPNAVVAKFFDKSELLLINSVCCYMRYRVIYFQCLCYLALPLCTVSMHLTRCVLWHVVCLFFLFLICCFFEAPIYANEDYTNGQRRESALCQLYRHSFVHLIAWLDWGCGGRSAAWCARPSPTRDRWRLSHLGATSHTAHAPPPATDRLPLHAPASRPEVATRDDVIEITRDLAESPSRREVM